ncbi:hypothetical protein NDR87_18780 [Nocardia sp. CDC159]|uniref:Uncharacterized protein n=1 Tax=Nocardia pulmonis TaxID=2951408 RepID=A0A9X2E8I3_9NOCA|nr:MULTISPECIES: hypothetical protein [Nocardia]MCM6776264.1 hypothetical protein [Nocardia pulmonis]MCM6788410.1 hypothetical protein [Nocardia sp. CDC159]
MMANRLTDEQLAEIAHAIPYSYEAGDYPPDLSDWARVWLGPDGGTLALLNELRAERARLNQLEERIRQHYKDFPARYMTGDPR